MSAQPNLILILFAFYAAFAAATLWLRGRGDGERRRPVPPVMLAVFGVTAALSLIQFPVPAVLDALRRDPARLAAGEWWRLVTPLFVQDGGLAGTVSNLVAMALLGFAGARLWSAGRWLVLYFGTGIAAEVVAYAWLHQGFAGNSIAICGLAAGLALGAARSGELAPVTLAGISLLGGGLLLALRDLHGAAYVIGLALAFVTVRPLPALTAPESDARLGGEAVIRPAGHHEGATG